METLALESLPDADGTTNATLEKDPGQPSGFTEVTSPSNSMSPTTEEDWSPFPPGDILNNAFLKKARFCLVLCFDEQKLVNIIKSIIPITSIWLMNYLSVDMSRAISEVA